MPQPLQPSVSPYLYKACELGALWHTKLNLYGGLTHVRNDHKEEEHGKYQVW